MDSILHCILHHRYRDGRIPQTLEAKILFDADKLDSIGAVGIARAFLFAGEIPDRQKTSYVFLIWILNLNTRSNP